MRKLDGKYSERVQIPEKAFLSPTLGTCHTILRPASFEFPDGAIVNNRRFTGFFDRYFPSLYRS